MPAVPEVMAKMLHRTSGVTCLDYNRINEDVRDRYVVAQIVEKLREEHTIKVGVV